jgi:hypothetical protein
LGRATVAATTEAGEPNVGANCHTIWYRWTAPSTGKFWFADTAAGSFYASVTVYAGNGH